MDQYMEGGTTHSDASIKYKFPKVNISICNFTQVKRKRGSYLEFIYEGMIIIIVIN